MQVCTICSPLDVTVNFTLRVHSTFVRFILDRLYLLIVLISIHFIRIHPLPFIRVSKENISTIMRQCIAFAGPADICTAIGGPPLMEMYDWGKLHVAEQGRAYKNKRTRLDIFIRTWKPRHWEKKIRSWTKKIKLKWKIGKAKSEKRE
jgi:hypothetical protein